jgi:acyl-CoA thioester hydrolase
LPAVAAPYIHRLRVRYGECDAQGVVFNAHYLAFFDIAITELWRAAFGSYDVMLERGVDIVVAEAHVRYLKPARFDDVIDLEILVTRLGNTGMTTSHTIRRDGEELVLGEIRHVFVDPNGSGKKPIPDWVRAGLEPYTDG